MLDPDLFDQDNLDKLANEMLYMHDPETTEAERIQEILDAEVLQGRPSQNITGM